MITMKRTFFILSILAFCSCGSGDTGEGYSDTTGAHNTEIGPTDSTTSAVTGDHVNPDSNSQADPSDERHRPDKGLSPNEQPDGN
jgi:hypothetical protein